MVRRLTLRDEAEILAAEASADIHPEGRAVQRLLIEGAVLFQQVLAFPTNNLCARCDRNGLWP